MGDVDDPGAAKAPERILVGVDGSAGSLRALRWAAELAGALGAEVVAVHAQGLLERLGDEVVPSRSHREEIRRRFEAEWCAPLDRPGLRSRSVLRDGPPVAALLAAATEEAADLIVVGSRGVGGFPELLLGSTSTQVAQHAPCPVTIIPAG